MVGNWAFLKAVLLVEESENLMADKKDVQKVDWMVLTMVNNMAVYSASLLVGNLVYEMVLMKA